MLPWRTRLENASLGVEIVLGRLPLDQYFDDDITRPAVGALAAHQHLFASSASSGATPRSRLGPPRGRRGRQWAVRPLPQSLSQAHTQGLQLASATNEAGSPLQCAKVRHTAVVAVKVPTLIRAKLLIQLVEALGFEPR